MRVLEIDWGHLPLAGATRRDKPKWKKDPVTHRWAVVADRWHTGMVDSDAPKAYWSTWRAVPRPLVASWLQAQPRAWRGGITHATIDLPASYAWAVADALPDTVVEMGRKLHGHPRHILPKWW